MGEGDGEEPEFVEAEPETKFSAMRTCRYSEAKEEEPELMKRSLS